MLMLRTSIGNTLESQRYSLVSENASLLYGNAVRETLPETIYYLCQLLKSKGLLFLAYLLRPSPVLYS
jgi:hypothetical protein